MWMIYRLSRMNFFCVLDSFSIIYFYWYGALKPYSIYIEYILKRQRFHFYLTNHLELCIRDCWSISTQISKPAEAEVVPCQGGTRPIFWDETETEKLDQWKFNTRPRPRKSGCWFFNETRPTRDCLIFIYPRQDLTQNSGRDRDETKSLGVFFYETETQTWK